MHREAITAIMFDYNGVIADTDVFDEKAVSFACQQMGIIPPNNYHKYFSGRTLTEGFKQYLLQLKEGALKSSSILQDLIEQKRSFDVYYPENIFPYQNTMDFIDTLSNLGKFHLALVTGARRVLIDIALEKLHLQNIFSVVVTAEDYNLGKPNPESYLHAISLLGVNPDQTVGIEDHPLGVKAVKSSGAACIAVTQTHSSEELQEADLVVNSLMDRRVLIWLNEKK